MKYVALLRGINVGGNKKVEMKRLKTFFEALGCTNVSTYINSGNVIIEFEGSKEELIDKVKTNLKNEFGFEIPVLIKTQQELKRIAEVIPKEWQNNTEQKTDVAYLFAEIDSEEIADMLPIKKELVNILYVKGAVIWNVKREDVIKSQLAKIIGHKIYASMTVRNVNTARFLGNLE